MSIKTGAVKDLRRLQILENIVSKFIQTTGQSISFIDLGGEWRSSLKLESFTGFCRRVISSDKGHYLCRECNNAFEKTKDGKVDISTCHMGVTIVSVPIKEKNNNLLLSYGQFLLEETKKQFYEKLPLNSKKLMIDYDELKCFSKDLKVFDKAELDDRIELLKLFSNYVNVTENEFRAREQYFQDCQEKLEIENKLSNLEFETMKTKTNQTFMINALSAIINIAYKEDAEQTADLLCDLLHILLKNNILKNSTLSTKEEEELIEEFKRLQAIILDFRNCSPMIEEVDKYMEEQFSRIILQVIAIIRARYAEELTLDSIAKEVFVTPEYLSRLFKKETGKNFTEYLIGVRMKEAQRLLKNNQFTVGQVASKVGYKDPSYFSRSYKKWFGFTPRTRKS